MKRPLLWLIVGFAFLIRIIYLGAYPLGFTADEASQGYTAYSLLKTGQDEWGISWPVTSFRAFADYRAPLQTYLIIPSIAILGLNEFAVRLPSAIFGTLAVLSLFLLVGQLFPDRKKLPLIAALLLAISPWHIQFSRTALEANFASFLFPMGLYFLLKGIRRGRSDLIYSALFFGIGLYSYLAAKLFIPLFLFAFTLLNFKKIIAKPGKFVWFVIIILVFAAPIYADTLFGPGNARGKDLIITNLSAGNLESIKQEQFTSKLSSVSPIIPRVFSNKLTFTLGEFITNYVSYLSPTFWFTEGGREITYSVFPGFGLLYLFMFPLAVFGLYSLIKINHPAKKILFLWLFLGIIPAAITKDGYRPNRVGSLLVFWEIIASLGFWELFKLIPSNLKKVAIALSVAIATVSVISYFNLYFFLSPAKYPRAMSYGYRELFNKIKPLENQYEEIIFDRGNQSQAFTAFYTQIDPLLFQSFSKDWWKRIEERDIAFLDQLDPYTLGKYTYKTFDENSDLKPKVLIVVHPEKYNVHPNLKKHLLDTINYPDGSPAFYILSYVEEK